MRKISLALVFLVLPAFVFADLPTIAPARASHAGGLAQAGDLAKMCHEISSTENSCQNLNSSECRAILEKCADYYDSQSAEIAEDLTKTKQQKDTLLNQISSLKKKITGLEYKINQGTLMVKDLNLQINDTQKSIDNTTLKIQESQKQITSILRSIYEQDQKSSLVILIEGNLSDFFSNLAYLESLNSKVSSLLESTINLRSYLGNQRVKMDTEKGQLQKTIQIQNLQKKENEQKN